VIISQTPYRVSFAGGGTDLPAFCREEPGAVLSAAINHHMYVTLHPRFESNLRVAYSQTETVARAVELRHELVREALAAARLDGPLEITTIGDVPAGTGLGSSSSLTVGLLQAMYGYRGEIVTRDFLASEACRIEIDVLHKPIGRQDQYAAAFGGLNYMRFNPDDTVFVEPVPCRAETLAELERRALLLYTNQTRGADAILQRQSDSLGGAAAPGAAALSGSRRVMREMRDLADAMRHALAGRGDLDEFARLLHQGWELKRSLGCGISNARVDEWYQAARAAGAQGGKLLGAGGGGFLFLLAPVERHPAIEEALGCPRRLNFQIDRHGSRNIFIQH
jgi:D-glycero-alpha-D-manno-heptose-7-phosphate kinase